MRGSKVRGNNLGEGLGCRGDVQRLPGRCAKVAGEMCKGCREDVQRLPGRCASVGKQSQLLLQPTEVGLGLQVGVEFDSKANYHLWRKELKDDQRWQASN